jgi:hypothetical protein
MRAAPKLPAVLAIGIASISAWSLGCEGSRDDDPAAQHDGGPAELGPACDGGRMRTYYRDADGDGFGVPGDGFAHACESDPPAGLADNGRDCDDSDPEQHEQLFVDDDGDGYGNSAAPACVAADAAGHSRLPGDCDDANPERFPLAAEGWFDALDADCDGQDNPSGCVAAPGVPHDTYATGDVAELPPLDGIPVDTTPACEDQADLYFAVLNGCPICGGGLATVVVANAGGTATGFRVTSDLERIDVSAELPPQQVADALSIELSSPEATITVAPLGDVDDCRPDDNRGLVRVGFTDCE